MALAGGHEGGAVTPSGRKPTPHAVTPLIRERGPVGRQATHSSYWATRSVCEGPRATGGYVTVTSLFTVFFYFPFYCVARLLCPEMTSDCNETKPETPLRKSKPGKGPGKTTVDFS